MDQVLNWLEALWPPSWAERNIADKELVPIVLAVAIWNHKWIHRNFLVRCDNEAVVHVIHQPVVTQGVFP